MGRGTQAGDAVNVVVRNGRVADGGETLLSVHARRSRASARWGQPVLKIFDLELAVCEIVPGELRMGVDRGAVARFPTHHDGFQWVRGAPSEVGAQVRFVRKSGRRHRGVGDEPPLDIGFDRAASASSIVASAQKPSNPVKNGSYPSVIRGLQRQLSASTGVLIACIAADLSFCKANRGSGRFHTLKYPIRGS